MNMLEMVRAVMLDNGLGEPTALNTGGPSDAGTAERIIEREAQTVLLEDAWAFNVKGKLALTPDGSSHIQVPDGTLIIDVDDADMWKNVRQVGDRLYDFDNNTDEFDQDVSIMVTLRYGPECFPMHMKQYLVARASRAMAAFRKDSARFNYLQGLERDAFIRARQVENDLQDVNITNTDGVQGAAGHIDRLSGGSPWVA